jgi:two-component system, cell cycle sensor histidine kinase and response regulator CckA
MKKKSKEKTPLNVLYLEDSPRDIEIIRELLTDEGYDLNLDCTEKEKEFTSLLRRKTYDVILSDFTLPGFDAFVALHLRNEICPLTPFICVSGSIGEETAIELVKNGAVDYVLKDRMVRLPSAINRALVEIKEKDARRQAEELLRENETRLRATFENANVGVCIISLDGLIIKVNNEMSNIFGYSCEELERMTVNSITYQDDKEISSTFMQKAISEGNDHDSFDKRYTHKNGHIIWGNVSSVLVRDTSGKPQYFISHVQDVTKRRQAEEALKESEEKFRTFAEQSPNMIFINKMGRVVYANTKCVEIMGYTKEEFYSPDFNFSSITAPEYIDILKAFYKRHLNGEEVPPYEYTIITKLGKRIDVIITSKLIPYKNERAILGIITDITERKRTESLLQENQDTINAIVETSQDWIWSIDSNGSHTYSNPAVEKILGYKPEEIIGITDIDLLHDEDKEKVQSLLRENQQSGWSNLLLRWRHKNGTYRYLESNAVPILDNEGDFIGFRGVDRDITERKKIENYIERIGDLKQQLLSNRSIKEKFNLITNCLEESFDADFARIWIIKDADLCEKGCRHAAVSEGPDVCRNRTHCLHLVSSSGRYTLINGSHMRVPYGCYKIGRIASREDDKFVSNDVVNDARVHDREWAKSIGLVSFAGYKITAADHSPIGVMALFRNRKIEKFEEKYLEDIAQTVSQVIIADLAEEMLSKSESRYRALVESQVDMISRYKPDTTLTFVNDAYCKFYGKIREDIIGHRLLEWIQPEFQEKAKKDAEDMVNNPGLFVRDEISNYRYDGKECWIQWITQGIKDENGMVVEIQTVGRDITERKEMEKSLRESEQSYKDLIDGMNEIVWVIDLDCNLINVNKTAVDVLGYSIEELFNIGIFGVDASLKKEEVKALAKVMPMNKTQIFETTHRTKEGKIIPIELYSNLITYQGREAILGIARDITERKRSEEALRQAQKLEGLGTLAGGIAHDFNNILAIILAYNTGIKRFKDDTKKFDLAIDTITKAVERGKTIVQQILTFARKTGTTFDVVNVNEVVMEIMTMICETFPKTLTYTQNLDKGIPVINADRSQLYQAILNICVNARDVMQDGGILAINTRITPSDSLRAQHPDVTDNNYICIEVSDTGEGMDQEVRKRIFEPFFTTKGIGKGTGLGLAVVFGIIQTHHGFIDVESEVGEGTTFKLYLPMLKTAGPVTVKDVEKFEEISGGTETLLVVEDEVMLMMSLQMVLFEKGYNVLTAKDGLEALKVYQENKDDIALVLTDLGLPTITGLEVCQRIKKIKSNERVILATGYLDPEMKSEFLKAGIQNFLFKPYDLRKVLNIIREVLDEK